MIAHFGPLGGRAAEEVIFGEPEVTTGASGDRQQVGCAQNACRMLSPPEMWLSAVVAGRAVLERLQLTPSYPVLHAAYQEALHARCVRECADAHGTVTCR